MWVDHWVFKWTYLCLLLSSWWCKFTDANPFSTWNNASKIAIFLQQLYCSQIGFIVLVPSGRPSSCSQSMSYYRSFILKIVTPKKLTNWSLANCVVPNVALLNKAMTNTPRKSSRYQTPTWPTSRRRNKITETVCEVTDDDDDDDDEGSEREPHLAAIDDLDRLNNSPAQVSLNCKNFFYQTNLVCCQTS